MTQRLADETDEALMRLYQLGNEEAFNELYARYSGRVYGYVRKRLKDPQAANDVFQATFTKLHRSRDQFNQSLPFAPWIFTITRNALLDWVKSRAVSEKGLEALFQQERIENEINSSDDYSLRVDLDTLPDSQKKAIEMRYYDDLPFEEIAKRLETSPANVRQLISRGVRQLKNVLGGRGGKT